MPRGGLRFPGTRRAENREGERERKVGSNLVKDKAKSKRRKTKGRAKVISARRSNGCDYKKKSRFLNVTTVERNVLSTS